MPQFQRTQECLRGVGGFGCGPNENLVVDLRIRFRVRGAAAGATKT